MFNQLKCAAKDNLAFGFVLRNVEEETCRYFYAPENNTVEEKSNLVRTEDDMTNVRKKSQKLDIVDHWTGERGNYDWKSYKIKTNTVFTTLIQVIPMGCEDTVFIATLLKNYNVNCLTFDRNTTQPNNRILCLFRALDLHLRSNNELEQENVFHAKNEERDTSKSQGSQLNDIPKNEDIFHLNIFFTKCCFPSWTTYLLNLLVEVIRNTTKVSSFYVTTITLATSATLTQNSNLSVAISVTHFFKKWQTRKTSAY